MVGWSRTVHFWGHPDTPNNPIHKNHTPSAKKDKTFYQNEVHHQNYPSVLSAFISCSFPGE